MVTYEKGFWDDKEEQIKKMTEFNLSEKIAGAWKSISVTDVKEFIKRLKELDHLYKSGFSKKGALLIRVEDIDKLCGDKLKCS